MGLNKHVSNIHFDVRLQDWNQRQGLISKEDVVKYRQQLPDMTNACEPIQLDGAEAPDDALN